MSNLVSQCQHQSSIKIVEDKHPQDIAFIFKTLKNLTLLRQGPLSYRNQSIDLQSNLKSKSMDRFLYENGLRHERVKN